MHPVSRLSCFMDLRLRRMHVAVQQIYLNTMTAYFFPAKAAIKAIYGKSFHAFPPIFAGHGCVAGHSPNFKVVSRTGVSYVFSETMSDITLMLEAISAGDASRLDFAKPDQRADLRPFDQLGGCGRLGCGHLDQHHHHPHGVGGVLSPAPALIKLRLNSKI